MRRLLFLLGLILGLSVFCGCGRKAVETQRQNSRLELEAKARRETDAANKAISEMNRKMFRPRVNDKDGKAVESGSKVKP